MNSPHPSQKDYRVTLEAFEGPLDLLLFLVRRAEVDLQDIPIAEITDQYLEVLHHTRGDDVDIEQAGEFLVMAATLVEIKSRSLSPPERSESDEGELDASGDPRDELIRQLLAYQRIRAAGDALEVKKTDFSRRYPVATGFDHTEFPPIGTGLELEDLHVMDLADAYERIASAIDFGKLGDHVVELDDTPIALYEQDLVDQLGRRSGRSLTLQDAFAGRQPVQRVGMFLAVLELVRRFQVRFEQEGDGPVELVLRPEEDWTTPAADDQPD
ncbi:MAG: segregation/condensation protein A [Phycisphaerales bacterium]|jgi:segregation and condensation protein A|nr:segregation/condensation protein A [Phycisphaerales bacterium]